MTVKERRKKIAWFVVYLLWIVADIELSWTWDRNHLFFLGAFWIGTAALCFAELDDLRHASIGAVVAAAIGITAIFVLPSVNLQSLPPARHLTSEQRALLVDRLKQFSGQKVALGSPFGDDEAEAYRNDFVEVFTEAQWAIDGHIGKIELKPPLTSVWVSIHGTPGQPAPVPPAAIGIVATLVDLHIVSRDTDGNMPIREDPSQPPDRIWLIVGKRG